MDNIGQKTRGAQVKPSKDYTPGKRSALQTLIDRILRRRPKNDKTIYPLF